MVIHPSALPDGAGLFLFDGAGSKWSTTNPLLPLGASLVKVSQEFTGS